MIGIAPAHLNKYLTNSNITSIFAKICKTVFKYHLSITKPAGGPDLVDACAVHEALDEVPLLLGLKGDKVHATFPAQRNHVFISEVFYCHGSS